jgi:hypothetical protein
MKYAGEEPQAAMLKELARSVAELRAELLVTQAALAAIAADQARATAEPAANLGDFSAKVLGFAEAAARGLAETQGRAESVTAAASRFVDWAEGFLRARR